MVCKTCLYHNVKKNTKTNIKFVAALLAAELALFYSNQDLISANALLVGFGMATAGGSVVSGISNISPDQLVVAYNQTIADYTQPSAYVGSSGDSTTSDPLIVDDTGTATTDGILRGTPNKSGQKITDVGTQGKTITSAKFRMKKAGVPTGNITCEVIKDSDKSVVGTFTETVTVGSMSASWTDYTFTHAGFALPAETWHVQVKLSSYAGSPPSDFVDVAHVDSDVYSSGNATSDESDRAGEDQRLTLGITNRDLPVSPVDDDTTTTFETNSEINPNIYVDAGSSKLISHLAIYFHANTTCTELKIQVSDDAAAWTDVKIHTFASFTAGSWDFVRFNVANARYVRIYGTDGTAKVLAVSEIKYLTHTESDLSRTHGHFGIDATNNTLGLNGA